VDGNVTRVLNDPVQIETLARTNNFEAAENSLVIDRARQEFQPKMRQIEAQYALVGD
jgi:hypothetical protein